MSPLSPDLSEEIRVNPILNTRCEAGLAYQSECKPTWFGVVYSWLGLVGNNRTYPTPQRLPSHPTRKTSLTVNPQLDCVVFAQYIRDPGREVTWCAGCYTRNEHPAPTDDC